MTDVELEGRSRGDAVVARFQPSFGARVTPHGTLFRSYSTSASTCSVRLFDASGRATRTEPMDRSDDGSFAALLPDVGAGALYKLVLDGRELPDPYARFMPEGVHGPAMVVEPTHEWRHGLGVSRPLSAHVIYELHLGTFTPEGTYRAAASHLRELAQLGVTAIELMPLSSFGGQRGWGYDGVAHFAPHPAYGSLDELCAFIDEAHGLGLAVFLDIVYNHFGPSGNYLGAFSPEYFTRDINTPWGDALDYGHEPMRRYLLESAHYWLHDIRFDGLRLDAVHEIHDRSKEHILAELVATLRETSPAKILIAEDDRNEPRLITDTGLDGIWADDFHHQVHVTLTREADGYYEGYTPGALGIADTLRAGWLYQGQVYPPTGKARGHSGATLDAPAFIYCIQNHDQIGNRAFGERLNHVVSPAAYAAASALLLFVPMTPLLFMGQEWAASTPFQYFTDHDAELGALVSKGRREEFKRFSAFTNPEARERIPDPQAASTFESSKLRWEERATGRHGQTLALYKALLHLRRTDPVLAFASRDHMAARSEGSALVVERWNDEGRRRIFVANFSDVAIQRPTLVGQRGAPLSVVLSSGETHAQDELAGWEFAIFADDP